MSTSKPLTPGEPKFEPQDGGIGKPAAPEKGKITLPAGTSLQATTQSPTSSLSRKETTDEVDRLRGKIKEALHDAKICEKKAQNFDKLAEKEHGKIKKMPVMNATTSKIQEFWKVSGTLDSFKDASEINRNIAKKKRADANETAIELREKIREFAGTLSTPLVERINDWKQIKSPQNKEVLFQQLYSSLSAIKDPDVQNACDINIFSALGPDLARDFKSFRSTSMDNAEALKIIKKEIPLSELQALLLKGTKKEEVLTKFKEIVSKKCGNLEPKKQENIVRIGLEKIQNNFERMKADVKDEISRLERLPGTEKIVQQIKEKYHIVDQCSLQVGELRLSLLPPMKSFTDTDYKE